MTDDTARNPKDILAELLAASAHPRRQRTLNAIHDLCRRLHQSGGRDFAVATIAKQCEKSGICKAHSLYHGLAADYRKLINAWGAFGGPPSTQPTTADEGTDILMRIPDPAIRSIMQGIIAERDKFRAQVNTLKNQTRLVIDMRPASAPSVGNASFNAEPETKSHHFDDADRAVLRIIASKKFLEDEGWKEGDDGEILTVDTHRVVFPYGFMTIIRKLAEP